MRDGNQEVCGVTESKSGSGWMKPSTIAAVVLALAVALPLVLAWFSVDKASRDRLGTETALKTVTNADVQAAFDRIGFNVRNIRGDADDVPRVFLTSLPRELPHITNAGQRKALFLTTMLPLVLEVNEGILEERARLLSVHDKVEAGKKLSSSDRKWLKAMQKKYRVEERDFDTLLRRINIIPPSLALAQAAIESGWGTSRFAQNGNALFGQWTWGAEGMIPKDRREGATHRVKAFDRLIESVEGYARNLNTHRAYRSLREKRQALTARGEQITGPALTPTLIQYSERREDYINDLNAIIRGNRLTRFDSGGMAEAALEGPNQPPS